MGVELVLKAAMASGSPEAAARVVLTEFWSGTLPVNPGDVCRRMGVTVRGMGNPFDPWPYSGYFSRMEDGAPLIQYNQDDAPVRKRFTVAHELGHYVLGHNAAPRDLPESFSASSTIAIERSANRFAAELLMPASAVRKAALSGTFASVEDLASAFAVSKVAMNFRMKNLRLSVW